MAGDDIEIFAFDSSETQSHSTSIERVELSATNIENLRSPLNYQTTKRIEKAKSILLDHSQLAFQSLKSGEPICLVRAKLIAMLSPNWTSEKEQQIFSSETISSNRDYTIVTPSHAFIEIDDCPKNSSFASSYSTKNSSYKSSSYSPAYLKSPERHKRK